MVTDEQVLAGFANLHQVITTGFDAVRAEMSAMRAEIRSEISALENRMMRRFDRIDERLEDHERRITALERHNRNPAATPNGKEPERLRAGLD